MGNYKEIDGNVIEGFKKGEFDVIAHGCNCYATMGAGIALTIGKEFPEAYWADKNFSIPNGIKRLGKLTWAEIEDLGIIFNLYSQYNPGPDFRLDAFRKSLVAMKKVMKKELAYTNLDGKLEFLPENIRIGLPLIGCGIGGGKWPEVAKVIQEELADYDVTIVHFKERVVGVNYFPTSRKVLTRNGRY